MYFRHVDASSLVIFSRLGIASRDEEPEEDARVESVVSTRKRNRKRRNLRAPQVNSTESCAVIYGLIVAKPISDATISQEEAPSTGVDPAFLGLHRERRTLRESSLFRGENVSRQ